MTVEEKAQVMEAYLHLDIHQESRDGPSVFKVKKVKAVAKVDTWNFERNMKKTRPR